MSAPTDTITIPLLRGYSMMIDAIDADLATVHWIADRRDDLHIYARGKFQDKRISLHRVIGARMTGRDLFPSEVVDHINHDCLDNRRSNLRVVTQAENNQNRNKNVFNVAFDIQYRDLLNDLHQALQTHHMSEFIIPALREKYPELIAVNEQRKRLAAAAKNGATA